MAAQKKKTGKKAAPPPQKQACPGRREVGGFVCLLLALCVLVSYFGVQAFFLTLLEKLLKGLTGYGYWLWAAALAVVGVVLVGHGGRPVCLRVTGTLAIPVLSGSLLHLLLCRVAYAPGAIGLPSLRDLWVDGLSLRGGGALSGGLAALLKAGFSSVVAGVLLALLLAGAVLLAVLRTGTRAADTANLTVYLRVSPLLLLALSGVCCGAVDLGLRLLMRRDAPIKTVGLEFELCGQPIRLRAAPDTGCHLRDPITCLPVLVVSYPDAKARLPGPAVDFLEQWFAGATQADPPPGARLRLVPCGTAADRTLLPGFAVPGIGLITEKGVLGLGRSAVVFAPRSFGSTAYEALYGNDFL